MNKINLEEVIIVNGIGIMLAVYLLMMRSRNRKTKDRREYLFDAMIWLVIEGSLSETVSFIVDGRMFWGAVALNYISNTLSFFSTCLMGFIWCLYVDYRIFNSRHRIKKRIKILMIPLIADALICLVNFSGCGILFKVSQNNIYQRGKCVMIVYLFLFFYFVYSICLADNSEKRGLHIHRFPAYYYVIPCMAGTALQGLTYGITLGWTAASAALLFVYIELQSMNSLVDTLSGLYNRRYLDDILDYIEKKQEFFIYGIMMDVNDFKRINDSFGHTEGDDAIRNIGKILSDSIPQCGIAIRYAGDEFIILLNTKSEQILTDTIKRINDNISEFNKKNSLQYTLSVSSGYGRYDSNSGDVREFISEIDKKMYIAKNKYYEENNIQRRE